MTLQLYPDQEEVFQRTRQALATNQRVLVQAATGFGKTVLGGRMVQGSQAKGRRSIFNVPRLTLLKQTHESFVDFDIAHGWIAADEEFDPSASSYLSTTVTLLNRIRNGTAPQIDLLIQDEAHFGGKANQEINDHYKALGAKIVPLSATPEFPGGRGMDSLADVMVKGPTIEWLIQNGRLSNYTLFCPSRPNYKAPVGKDGEFQQDALSALSIADTKNTGDIVGTYIEHAMGKLGVTFATSIEHSILLAEEYRQRGVPAAHVDGDTPPDILLATIKAFARRELLQLTCADLLVFGFDLKAFSGVDVTIEAISDGAPTRSITKQKQKWGRGMRWKPYPVMIFDHAGNAMNANGTANHGLPDDDYDWKLAGRTKAQRQAEAASPIKRCNVCYSTHRPQPVCPYCGTPHPIQGRMVETVAGELREYNREGRRIPTPAEEARIKTAVNSLAKTAIERGVNVHVARNWAKKKVREKMGF